MASRRAVVQHRFNPENKMTNEKGDVVTKNGKIDPMLELNQKLNLAVQTGELTYDQVARIKTKIIPAYFGRLGADGNQAWRSLSSTMVMYQNIRLLGMVVLSSLVDAGLISIRSTSSLGLDIETAKALFKGPASVLGLMKDHVFNKASTAELYEFARTIGAIREDITEHMLTDPILHEYMSPKHQMWNEYFFRMVRMHQWTNLMRVTALRVGKDTMLKYARDPKNENGKKFLKELGVTHQEVLAWDAAEQPAVSNDHQNVIYALHQFIDEAVIRPDATQRPPWASDANMIMFAHLKSFLWGYHETVLRRVWKLTKDSGSMSTIAIPFLFLALATIPLAAVGYELRQMISNAGEPPRNEKEGGDYFWELIQRSGMLGVLQLAADVDQAEDFGRFSFLALGGPTLSQFEDFVTKDFDEFAVRSVPVFAQSAALRRWVTSEN